MLSMEPNFCASVDLPAPAEPMITILSYITHTQKMTNNNNRTTIKRMSDCWQLSTSAAHTQASSARWFCVVCSNRLSACLKLTSQAFSFHCTHEVSIAFKASSH